jgi:hypothetical protein
VPTFIYLRKQNIIITYSLQDINHRNVTKKSKQVMGINPSNREGVSQVKGRSKIQVKGAHGQNS